ncbi:MAG: hypothetical protein ACLTDR_11405 [Adlercreutzia equolifaciens]
MAKMSCICSRGKLRAATAMSSTGRMRFCCSGAKAAGSTKGLIDRFADCCRRIPMRERARSLNLSNAVAIAAYDALAQRSFPGLV